jgi:dienelactone hydrolase
MSPRVVRLPTGADARLRNEGNRLAVVLVDGGTAREVPGTWSATSELLARELAGRRPDVGVVEVRYRVKTWNALPSCVADAAAALDLVTAGGAVSALLVGFSMGGAVSISVADHASVAGVLGLAPWIPERLPLDAIRGKRFDVVHGAWDRALPGIPGVSPRSSREGFERVLAAGAHGTYTLIARGLHGCAVRRPSGRLLPLPRWRAWVHHTARAVDRFVADDHDVIR